jgi:RibD C-terminal domain
MAKLIYTAIASLDGYVEDEEGRSDWAMPEEEVHAFVNDLERPIGTYLYGRRMYETMVFWETASTTRADEPSVFWDYAGIWRAAEKIVYSRRFRRYPARGRGSSASLIETPSGGSSSPRGPTSQLGGPSSQATQSARAWSTSATCSCARSWWEAASAPCKTTSARNSNLSMNAGSETASFTSTTVSV